MALYPGIRVGLILHAASGSLSTLARATATDELSIDFKGNYNRC
jgi:hypothetical protein